MAAFNSSSATTSAPASSNTPSEPSTSSYVSVEVTSAEFIGRTVNVLHPSATDTLTHTLTPITVVGTSWKMENGGTIQLPIGTLGYIDNSPFVLGTENKYVKGDVLVPDKTNISLVSDGKMICPFIVSQDSMFTLNENVTHTFTLSVDTIITTFNNTKIGTAFTIRLTKPCQFTISNNISSRKYLSSNILSCKKQCISFSNSNKKGFVGEYYDSYTSEFCGKYYVVRSDTPCIFDGATLPYDNYHCLFTGESKAGNNKIIISVPPESLIRRVKSAGYVKTVTDETFIFGPSQYLMSCIILPKEFVVSTPSMVGKLVNSVCLSYKYTSQFSTYYSEVLVQN